MVQSRIEFWMRLCSSIKRMVREFYIFYKFSIRRNTTYDHSILFKDGMICRVDFISMTMPFFDALLPIERLHLASFFQNRFIGSETHGSSFFIDMFLIFHDSYNGVCCFFIKFSGVCIWQSAYVSCKRDDCNL